MTGASQFPAEIKRLGVLAEELNDLAEHLNRLEREVYFLIQSMAQAGLSREDEDKLWRAFFYADERARSWLPDLAA
jgi:hypothetical protein